jgi:hypothetical protein
VGDISTWTDKIIKCGGDKLKNEHKIHFVGVCLMTNKQEFLQHLAQKKKKLEYINKCDKLLDKFNATHKDEMPTAKTISEFAKGMWSGYVDKVKTNYQILNDYADFCGESAPGFANAFREHISEVFEGSARKAVCKYEDALFTIPQDTIIAPFFLEDLTNDEFIDGFRVLQEFVSAVYKDIKCGSPFAWGWPSWKALTVGGINHNRIIKVLEALAGSGSLDNDVLTVDKKHFAGYDICKPMAKIKLTLDKFGDYGLHIEKFDNKKSPVFTISYPDTPNMITIMCSYFKKRRGFCRHCGDDCNGEDTNCPQYYYHKHIDIFSHRFVENPAMQTRDTYFLAYTDGVNEQLQEIYYWLYDEAAKYGFLPAGYEQNGGLLYKKGSKQWLLMGGNSSYHEVSFLFDSEYTAAVKTRLKKIFDKHPEKAAELVKKYPYARSRHDGEWFYFHDPSIDDVKTILELYKLENNIKLP